MNELTVIMQQWEDAEHTLNYCRAIAAKLLIQQCEIRGITRQKLALDTGYDKAYVRRVWRGQVQPSTQFMMRAVAAIKGEPVLEKYEERYEEIA